LNGRVRGSQKCHDLCTGSKEAHERDTGCQRPEPRRRSDRARDIPGSDSAAEPPPPGDAAEPSGRDHSTRSDERQEDENDRPHCERDRRSADRPADEGREPRVDARLERQRAAGGAASRRKARAILQPDFGAVCSFPCHDRGGQVPHPAIHAGFWPAITRRQSPTSLLPRLAALAASERGLWLGARDPEARRHYWKGTRC